MNQPLMISHDLKTLFFYNSLQLIKIVRRILIQMDEMKDD